MAAVIEQRMDRLEEAIQAFVTNVGIEFNKLCDVQMRTELELRAYQETNRVFIDKMQADTAALKQEMRMFRDDIRADTAALKQEMVAFKDDIRADTAALKQDMVAFKDDIRADTKAFKQGSQATLDRMQAIHDAFENRWQVLVENMEADTRAFKQEMRESKERADQERREMNRQWGQLANKMGTLVEDLVIPSLPRVIQELFQQPIVDQMIRRKRVIPGTDRFKEYDAIVVTPELVCVNSTKATLRPQYIDQFVQDLAEFRDYYPEYQGYPLIGIVASLHVDHGMLEYAEKTGFVVLATGDDLMDIINHPGFVPKRW